MKDKLTEFEEQNFDWLIDKFVKAYQNDWEQFVYDEYNKTQQDPPDGEDR